MKKARFSRTEIFGMNTLIRSRVFGERGEEALKAAEEEIIRLEAVLSRFKPHSDVGRINVAAGRGWVNVREETCRVLSRSLEFSRCGKGSFDVTAGPLADLWRSRRDSGSPPPEREMGLVLPLIDYTGLLLNSWEKAARLERKGQAVDLGGIGKGFAADRVIEVLGRYGIPSAFVNFGGNVAALGAKPDGSLWNIGIQHPRQEEGIIGVVSIVNKSVVTSGDYQQYFMGADGRRYHHILDPATGYPVETGLVSVTVVADSSTDADGLSTMLFVTGMEKGMELLKGFPGAGAVFVDTDLRVFVTGNLRDSFQAAEGVPEVFKKE